MGASTAKLIAGVTGKKEARVLMVGLDAAGKTTILYKLKLGEVVTTIPTIGFNVETMGYKNIVFTAWDVGGRDKIRPLWRHYYQDTQVVIMVVDSNDRERIGECKDELQKMSSEDELRDSIYAICCNKQDLPNAMNADELMDALDLRNFQHRWGMFFSCATSGDGLKEMLEWIVKATELPAHVGVPITNFCSSNLPPPLGGGAASAIKAAVASTGIPESPADEAARGTAIAAAVAATTIAEPIMTSVENDPFGYDPKAAHRRALSLQVAGDLDDEGLLGALRSGELDKSLYTHEVMLRCMHIHLSRMSDRSKGRQMAVDSIMRDIKTYGDHKSREYHMTHTYFWLQLLDISLQMSGEMRARIRSGYVLPEPTAPQGPHAATVWAFFKDCPWLLDHQMMSRYYSEKSVLDKEAFATFRMPDLRQLPSILSFHRSAAAAR